MPETVLITGATGNVGSELVSLLATRPDMEVKAATRNPESGSAQLLRRMNPNTVQPVAFDPEDEATLDRAMEGVSKLMVIVPLVGGMVGWQQAVAAAAGRAGVERVVKLSVDAARSPEEDEDESAVPVAHWRGEQILGGLDGVRFDAIRPTIFMQHFLMIPGLYNPGEDTFYLPTGDSGVAFNDARDIALMAEALLMSSGTQKDEPVTMTGPKAITGEEISDALSEASGRTIRWEADPDAFSEHSRATGSPEEIGGVYEAGRNGAFSSTDTEDFQQITGRLPRSFATFARDNAAYFSSGG